MRNEHRWCIDRPGTELVFRLKDMALNDIAVCYDVCTCIKRVILILK